MLKSLRYITITSILWTGAIQAAEPQATDTTSTQTFFQAQENYKKADFQAAFNELLPLAEQGNAKAQYAIGYLYYYGKGVIRNPKLAEDWINKSAAQHYTQAEQALAMMKKTAQQTTSTNTNSTESVSSNTIATQQTTSNASALPLQTNATMAATETTQTTNATITQQANTPTTQSTETNTTTATTAEINKTTQAMPVVTAKTDAAQSTSNIAPNPVEKQTALPSIQTSTSPAQDQAAAQPTQAQASITPTAPSTAATEAVQPSSTTQTEPMTGAPSQAPVSSEDTAQAPTTKTMNNEPTLAQKETSIAATETAHEEIKKNTRKHKASLSKDISKLPAKHFTIQLFSSSNEKEVVRYVKKHNLNNAPTYLLKLQTDGEVRFVLSYGDYTSQKEAKKTLSHLNNQLRQHGAWVKTFGSLHKELAK